MNDNRQIKRAGFFIKRKEIGVTKQTIAFDRANEDATSPILLRLSQ